MNHLLKYKNETLNQLSVLCGSTIKSSKAEKCSSLIGNLNFYLQLPSTINLIGIDIGIKNFSYCKIHQFDICSFQNIHLPVKQDNWKTIDLSAKFQSESPEFQQYNKYNQFAFNDLIHSRYYVSYLNKKVVELLDDMDGLSIFLIESQRIKSNNNKMTLPNILTNYLFESLFYSNMLGSGHILLPMNSNKMANFMINRFVEKSEKISSANSKKLRLKLLLYMANEGLIELPGVELETKPRPKPKTKIKATESKSESKAPLITSKSLLQWYNSQNPHFPIKKLDDFFDSYLYNLNFIYTYRNNLLLQHWLLHQLDISVLVDSLNAYQLKPTSEFFNRENIKLNSESNQLTSEPIDSVSLEYIERSLWEIT